MDRYRKFDPAQEAELLLKAEYLRMLRDLGEDDLYFGWEPVLRKPPAVKPVAARPRVSETQAAGTGKAKSTPQKRQKTGVVKPLGSLLDTVEQETTIYKLPLVNVKDKAAALQEHFQQIKDCEKCRLHKGRDKFVYGAGNPNADIMFIGEAPGAEENKTGVPFVGKAGDLLDKILAAMTLKRDDVYIGNIIKCRPPQNRDPQPDETALCVNYLLHQIAVIDPKLVIFLGRVSAQNLLGTKDSMRVLRQKWHRFLGRPAVVTYHPAALLYNEAYKKPLWEDMKKVMEYLNIPLP